MIVRVLLVDVASILALVEDFVNCPNLLPLSLTNVVALLRV